MSGQTVLITGTSTGIGLEIALGCARAGWRTVATMRDVARADRLRDAAATAGVADLIDVRPLDVTDPDAVTGCVEDVIGAYGRLDAVVNNAGAGHVGTLEQDSVDDVRAVMEVNFFGVLHVSRAALPHLRTSRGRLVTVSSVGGIVGQPFNEAYCAAKFAVEGYLESLAPLAATTGVRVTLVEPGAVASEFVTNIAIDADVAIAAAGVYGPALRAYLARTGQAGGDRRRRPDVAPVRRGPPHTSSCPTPADHRLRGWAGLGEIPQCRTAASRLLPGQPRA
ncbi:SDR family NAD(P)-dependent oxidoreductase [Micromonospora sp. NPDC049230]|uniref:SDR family NAD(P)-dependent oxidoreductase n=1 Tax=Micromonospora sp. NPDC049230 TaxID=3155502 RepID=UPI00340E2780